MSMHLELRPSQDADTGHMHRFEAVIMHRRIICRHKHCMLATNVTSIQLMCDIPQIKLM